MGAWRARVWSYSSRERTGPCSRACQCQFDSTWPPGTRDAALPAVPVPCAAVHAPVAQPAQHAQNQCDGPGRYRLFGFLSAENKRFVVLMGSELILGFLFLSSQTDVRSVDLFI